MADYHTHFCMPLPVTPDQGDEIQDLISKYTDYAEARVEGAEGDLDLSDNERAMFDRLYDPFFEDSCGLEIIFRGDQVLFTDIAGDPNLDLAGNFLLEIAKLYDLKLPLGFDYGCTATANRPGAFGGGACVVTEEGVEWLNARDWLRNKMGRDPYFSEEPPAAAPAP